MAKFLAAVEQGDMVAASELVHDDIVMEWPQSGERFRGKDNALKALMATEVKPQPAGEPRIVGGGDTWVMTMPLRYDDEVWQYVGIFQLEQGKIRRTTEFFGAPFPPSEARAPYTDR